MNKHRIAVTGLGVICSAGSNVDEFAANVALGKPCFSPITDGRVQHLRAKYAGLIPDFNPDKISHAQEAGALDRFVHLAVAAADQAFASASIDARDMRNEMGLVFATCSGPMQTIEKHYERIAAGNPSIGARELFAKRYYSGAKALCHAFGIEGFSTTVTTACSASAVAIGIASDLIRHGGLKAALVGGSDTFSVTTLAGFDGLKATGEGLCAPFSKPIGLNLGEGAAFIIIEEFEHAVLRKARIFAEILGFGSSNDAYHCSAPDPSGRGQALAMERALKQASLSPEAISYINAHGTGTAANDKAETKAIVRVLGQRAETVPVSSTKSIVGHCLGAAGCLEIIAGIACAQKRVFPPTASFTVAREGCGLDYLPDPGRPWNGGRIFMSNSFAFGGNNACVIADAGASVDIRTTGRPPAKSVEICITGFGIVSPAGTGHGALVDAVEKGCVHARQGEWEHSSGAVALVPDFDERMIDRRLDLHNMDRPSRFAVIAAKLAVIDAQFAVRPRDQAHAGFYLSLSNPPSASENEHIMALLQNNFMLNQVQAFPYIVPNSIAGNVSRALSLSGHNAVICAPAGSGLASMNLGSLAIAAGHVDACLCGAVDELSPRIIADNLSSRSGSDTFVAGEGAAMLMIESMDHALSRNAQIYAKVRAMAFSTDTQFLYQHDTSMMRLENTIRRAIDSAGIRPDDIDAICCEKADMRMKSALIAVLGNRERRIIDVSPQTGVGESSFALFCLACAVKNNTVEHPDDKNYILCTFSSPEGMNSVAVIEKIPARKA